MITEAIREQLAAIASRQHHRPAEPEQNHADHEEVLPDAKRARSRIIDVPYAPLPSSTTLEEARESLKPSMIAYLETTPVTKRLLCQVNPGVGKTQAATEVAFYARNQGLRVAYVMPRHEFFDDLLMITDRLGQPRSAWFHWMPRQPETPTTPETCHHSAAMQQWVARGHQSFKFCSGVCGFDFMENACLYWSQQKAASQPNADGLYPIVAIQHAHIATNHILMKDFDVVIGDESPLAAFPYRWHIPTINILPSNLKKKDAAYSMMKIMAETAVTMQEDLTISGPDLINLIGGVEVVYTAKRLSEAEDLQCKIKNPLFVKMAPYRHAADLIRLLYFEALSYQRGEEYIHRVLLRRDGLYLLLKRETTGDLPNRVIWLDATGDPELYRMATGWHMEKHTANVHLEGPIYQIVDSTYAKSQLISGQKASQKGQQLAACIRLICQREAYHNPLVVSHSQLASSFEWCQFTYFHGNRGSNAFQECDAVFVLGTPMPPVEQLELLARMIYSYRMEPFDARWCAKPVAYAGTTKAYIASGLWDDPDLALLLNQTREQEIVQSAHRIRPILAPKPIWLLTALPVEALPPTRLLSLAEALGVDVEHIDPLTLIDALEVARMECEQKGYCTSEDLMDRLDFKSRKTAYRYLDAISQVDPLDFPPITIKAVGRGRGRRAIGIAED